MYKTYSYISTRLSAWSTSLQAFFGQHTTWISNVMLMTRNHLWNQLTDISLIQKMELKAWMNKIFTILLKENGKRIQCFPFLLNMDGNIETLSVYLYAITLILSITVRNPEIIFDQHLSFDSHIWKMSSKQLSFSCIKILKSWVHYIISWWCQTVSLVPCET